MALILTDTQQDTLTVSFTDKKGNPAVVDGVPVWSSSDPTIVAVTPAADGMTALIVAQGPLGTVQINATGDADLGAGTSPVAGVLDVTVQASAAVSALVSSGAPVEQP